MREVNFLEEFVIPKPVIKTRSFPLQNVEYDVCDIEHSVAFIAFFGFSEAIASRLLERINRG